MKLTVRHTLFTILCIALLVFLITPSPGLAEESIHFHGYGELHYGNSNKSGAIDKMDNHRLVFGWTYKYNDRIKLNVEIDYEHAAKEMELEFAFIDFLLTESFNIRAGSMLMPVGFLNEYHEPPLFYSVERPYVQKYVIPTTWQEGGAGIFGRFTHGINYRLYLVNALDASGFTASNGIRKGRHKVSDAPSDDLAVVGRLEYEGLEGLRLGFSGYRGNTGQGTPGIGDAGVSLAELDVRYRIHGIELTGLYSRITIDDSEKINTVTTQAVGENITGSYVEAAYHAGKHFLSNDQDIVLFARHERFNTQDKMAGSLIADPANDLNVTTIGAAYFPVPKIAVKIDLENWKTDDDQSWEQVNVGLAYMY